MKEEDCRLCMFPDLRDNSNDFSVVDFSVDWFSVATSDRIGPLPLSSKDINIQNSRFIPHRMFS